MGVVKVNNTSLALAAESTQGTLPAMPIWYLLEPNQGQVTTFGATIATVERNPISKNRQRQKGTIVDLDSAVDWEGDLTISLLELIGEAFSYATFVHPADRQATPAGIAPITSGSGIFGSALASAATGNQFTHDDLGSTILDGTLVYARGFTNTVVNGIHEVTTGGSGTVTPVLGSSLVDETPALSKAALEICGVAAAAGDLVIAVASGVATLTSTTLDFTKLGWTPGQRVHIGGLTAANQFNVGGTAEVGFGRLIAVDSATQARFDKLSGNLVTNDGVGDTVHLLYGSFLRNVATDDTEFLERYYTFALTMPDLFGAGMDGYKLPEGNAANSLAINVPLNDKVTCSMTFVGTDTPVPTMSTPTNLDTNTIEPLKTEAINTTNDIARLRLAEADETGLATCVKSVTLTIENNVENEKCLGVLGASNTNQGNFGVALDMQVQLTDPDLDGVIRNNETASVDFLFANNDGAVHFDVPSLTLGGGDIELPENASVLMNLSGLAFEDPVFGTSLGISFFPVVP